MRNLIILGMIMMLGGCSIFGRQTPPPPVTNTVELRIIHPQAPAKIQLKEVKWRVLNAEEMQDILDEAAATNVDLVYFAVTPRGYESLSMNVEELERYIREQKAIIKYYQKVLPSHDSQ